jgi:ribosomal protein S18 acetylase RimI-like enzyme
VGKSSQKFSSLKLPTQGRSHNFTIFMLFVISNHFYKLFRVISYATLPQMRQDGVSLPAPSGFSIHRLKATKGDELIVTQLLAMEKKLWKKTDSWGGLLEKELARRNTFTLYATTLSSLPSLSALPARSASSSSEVVAYLIFTATGLVCHISKVVVVPEMRRQGLGRALVQAAVEIAKKERRVGSITLHVDADNVPALRLYSNLGFASEGMLEVSQCFGYKFLVLFLGRGGWWKQSNLHFLIALLQDYYSVGRHAHKMRLKLNDNY